MTETPSAPRASVAERPEPPPVETLPEPRGNPWLAMVLAWLLPGLGHFYLGRRGRAAIFCGLILASLGIGLYLDGKLWEVIPGQLLSVLGTLGCVGLGIPFFILRFLLEYQGDVAAQGYEYGGAFILTGGLLNLLLVLDAWDISRGIKE